MSFEQALAAARSGTLYPAVILYGAGEAERRRAAVELGRALLCAAAPAERPCGSCRHCRRIAWPEGDAEAAPFHPDFRLLARDLKTSTSVDAARAIVQLAQLSPFEARGQVFVVAGAETLTPEAANALLKILEEPPTRAPRHFLLATPSRLELLPTIRSRALAVFLGPALALDAAELEAIAGRFAEAAARFSTTGEAIHVLRAAAALLAAGDFGDPRAARPWSLAAAAVRDAAVSPRFAGVAGSARRLRRALFDLAADLLEAPADRQRGVSAERLVEGLVARRLAAERVV